MTDEVRANVFDQPKPDPKDLTPQYTELSNLLDFSEFDYENQYISEAQILTPQLEKIGYKVHFWADQPHNYLAHASARVCRCTDSGGGIRWFIYG